MSPVTSKNAAWIAAIILGSFIALQARAVPLVETPKNEPPTLRQSVIYNGQVVAENDPARESVVRIFSGSASCTATLITDRVLLTAAHCVNNVEPVLVVQYFKLGRNDAFTQGEFIISRLADKAYEFTPVSVDLAVITFKRSLTEGSNGAFKPMIFADSSVADLIGYGVSVFMIGAGRTESLTLSKDLMFAKGLLNGFSKESGTLKVIGDGNQGICTGDSGGPLTIFANGRHYLLGVASKVVTYGTSKCGREQEYKFVGIKENEWMSEQIRKAEAALK